MASTNEVTEMNLYQKLAKIRKIAEVIQKDKSGYGYKYVGIETILSRVTAGMDRYHVSLVPKIGEGVDIRPFYYKKVKGSGEKRYEEETHEFLATAPIKYVWVNNDNPEEQIEIPWFISGSQSDPSQAMGSALTYGLRYFLTQMLQIATPEDDPDNWRSKQQLAAESEDKMITEQIVNELDAAVKLYLAEHKDKQAAVKKLFSKYVKDGNYFTVANPEIATALLTDFNNTFIGKKE